SGAAFPFSNIILTSRIFSVRIQFFQQRPQHFRVGDRRPASEVNANIGCGAAIDRNTPLQQRHDRRRAAGIGGRDGPAAMPGARAGCRPVFGGVRHLYYVIEGRGLLRLNDELDASALVEGSLAMVPAGAVRSIMAQERMRVLAVQMHRGEAACA
ncbi:MAG: hypothetical protein ABIK79_16060, partial [Chloroflexota bacterium]